MCQILTFVISKVINFFDNVVAFAKIPGLIWVEFRVLIDIINSQIPLTDITKRFSMVSNIVNLLRSDTMMSMPKNHVVNLMFFENIMKNLTT